MVQKASNIYIINASFYKNNTREKDVQPVCILNIIPQ